MANYSSIRYAALAVAAVHRSLAFPNLEDTTQKLVSTRRDALTNYIKAIQLLASSLANDNISRELACVGSMLFISFEVLRGNEGGGCMVHIEGAFQILKTL